MFALPTTMTLSAATLTPEMQQRITAATMNNTANAMLAAHDLLKQDRARGLILLDEIFCSGTAPNPALEGPYKGELITLDLVPGLRWVVEVILNAWMPWQGKIFHVGKDSGDNIFIRSFLPLSRIFWPFYRGFVSDDGGNVRAFEFRTSVSASLGNPDVIVLGLNYDLEANPRFTVRRVFDELVQLTDDLYLGKAYLRWWSGKWQLVAYFTLERASASDATMKTEI